MPILKPKYLGPLLLCLFILGNFAVFAQTPQVILKLDDLKYEQGLVHPGWAQVIDFLNQKKVTGTIGLIGNSLEKNQPNYFDWIKARHQEGYEIWHHGYCHCQWDEEEKRIREYRGTSLEEQCISLQKTQDLAKEKLGITLRSYGAPYNSTDQNTLQAMYSIPELKVWMYRETKGPSAQYDLRRISAVNIEYPVHQADFKQFKKNYKNYKSEPLLVIQGHPRSWVEDPKRFKNFQKIVRYLKKQGTVFTTPYAYYLTKEKATKAAYPKQIEPALYDLKALKKARIKYQQEEPTYLTLVQELQAQADAQLNVGPFSVVNKKFLPASQNKHDYYSMGPYWWPNPDTEDGLPYIRKDGKVNPEKDYYDRPQLSPLTNAVFTLGLAYFYTQEEKYAQKAQTLIRAWFLDPATKMNPHLEYGQAIPGITEGRGIGLIETGSFIKILDALHLMSESNAIPKQTNQELQAWFDTFTHWMLGSPKGWDERLWHNNHGSSYDSQVVSYAKFIGADSIANLILDSVIIKRIDRQVMPDGSQPWELSRTKSMNYSLKNLDHLMENAILANHYGKDLWNYESADGRSITKAIHFLIPYMMEGKEWTYTQYGGIEGQMDKFKRLIWIAHLYLDDPLIEQTATKLFKGEAPSGNTLLLYPKMK